MKPNTAISILKEKQTHLMFLDILEINNQGRSKNLLIFDTAGNTKENKRQVLKKSFIIIDILRKPCKHKKILLFL